jgi:hypothetical protein
MLSALCALAVLGGGARAAHAHQSAVKYIDIVVDGARAEVRITVDPADVTEALGLPADARPTATAAAVPAAAAHVARWLALGLPTGAACAPGPATAERDPDGRLVVVAWSATCPALAAALRVDLSAFFAADPRHEALVTLRRAGAEHIDPRVVRAGAPVVELAIGAPLGLGDWVAVGLHHIFFGADHVAFVLALLLVVVIHRGPGGAWALRPPRAALRATAIVVTAFTLAHSATLIAAALGWVQLPSRLVESAIAASILYVAIAAVVRPDARWRFSITAGLGLVHGLGFASVLAERLPPRAVALPLVGFNLGVELGQLAIVALALPLLAALARKLGPARYRARALPVAAAPLAALAAAWLVDRAVGG